MNSLHYGVTNETMGRMVLVLHAGTNVGAVREVTCGKRE